MKLNGIIKLPPLMTGMVALCLVSVLSVSKGAPALNCRYPGWYAFLSWNEPGISSLFSQDACCARPAKTGLAGLMMRLSPDSHDEVGLPRQSLVPGEYPTRGYLLPVIPNMITGTMAHQETLSSQANSENAPTNKDIQAPFGSYYPGLLNEKIL